MSWGVGGIEVVMGGGLKSKFTGCLFKLFQTFLEVKILTVFKQYL